MSGRASRSRSTNGAACSGVQREPCQPSCLRARCTAGSEVPPIQIGIGCSGCGKIRMSAITEGMVFAVNETGSSLHTARIIAMPSSMRRPRSR
jgi:hypothetical protein